MLTLTRKVGETIRIGDDIEIVVKEIRKNQVRIGIVAPREVKIYREEVYDNIVAERRAATETDEDDSSASARESAPRSSAGASRNGVASGGSAGAARKGAAGARGTTTKRSGPKQSATLDGRIKP